MNKRNRNKKCAQTACFALVSLSDLGEGVLFGEHDAPFMRDISLHILLEDEVCEDALELVHRHVGAVDAQRGEESLQRQLVPRVRIGRLRRVERVPWRERESGNRHRQTATNDWSESRVNEQLRVG